MTIITASFDRVILVCRNKRLFGDFVTVRAQFVLVDSKQPLLRRHMRIMTGDTAILNRSMHRRPFEISSVMTCKAKLVLGRCEQLGICRIVRVMAGITLAGTDRLVDNFVFRGLLKFSVTGQANRWNRHPHQQGRDDAMR